MIRSLVYRKIPTKESKYDFNVLYKQNAPSCLTVNAGLVQRSNFRMFFLICWQKQRNLQNPGATSVRSLRLIYAHEEKKNKNIFPGSTSYDLSPGSYLSQLQMFLA